MIPVGPDSVGSIALLRTTENLNVTKQEGNDALTTSTILAVRVENKLFSKHNRMKNH